MATRFAGIAYMLVVHTAKQISKNRNYYNSAQDNISVYRPRLPPILKTESSAKPDLGKVGSMPDLNGKSLKDAEAELKENGFEGGEPTKKVQFLIKMETKIRADTGHITPRMGD